MRSGRVSALTAGSIFVLSAAPVLLGRVVPNVFTPSVAFSFGVAVCFAAMAISLHIVMGYARLLSLGHGAIAGVGGFTSGLLTAQGPQLSFITGVGLAAIAGTVVGALIGLAAKRLRGIWFALATLAFGVALSESIFKWRALTGGAGVEVPRPRIRSFILESNADYLGLAVLVLAALWLLDSNFSSTKFGRAVRATAIDEHVASSRGIAPGKSLAQAMALSGAMAGIGGALFVHLLQFVGPSTFSFETIALPIVALVAVGGLDSRAGVTVAASAYAIFPRMFAALRGWELAALGLVLVVAVVARSGAIRLRLRRTEPRTLLEGKGIQEGWSLLADREDDEPLPNIELVGVSVRRHGLQILDRVSLSVEPGSVVGLIGANGSGKTTLLNVISGFVDADEGELIVSGRNLRGASPEERAATGIGRSFDRVGIFPALSVREKFDDRSASELALRTDGSTCVAATRWQHRGRRTKTGSRGRCRGWTGRALGVAGSAAVVRGETTARTDLHSPVGLERLAVRRAELRSRCEQLGSVQGIASSLSRKPHSLARGPQPLDH